MKTFVVNIFTSDTFLLAKGALLLLLGPLNFQLAYLLLAIAIDLVFGIAVARRERQFSFGILFTKLRHKLFIYGMWIAMFHAFDMIAGLPDTARWAVVMMLASMEVFSAAKNTARLGYGKLADALESLYVALVKTQPVLQDVELPEKAQDATIPEGSASHAQEQVGNRTE